MDRLDNIIVNVMQKPISEPYGFEKAINTAFINKNITKKYVIKSLIKAIITLITGILVTTSAVFAKDISKWIYDIFRPMSTSIGVIKMVENGYLYNTEMEYAVSEGNSLKVNYILMDDYNLDIVLDLKSEDLIENITQVNIPSLLVTDEENNIIFCANKDIYEDYCKKYHISYTESGMDKNYTNGGYSVEILENSGNELKIIYKMRSLSNYPKSKKMNIKLKNISIYSTFKDVISDNFYEISGNWNFDISLPEEFYSRKTIDYEMEKQVNNFKLISAVASNTEMRVSCEIKNIKESIDLENKSEKELMNIMDNRINSIMEESEFNENMGIIENELGKKIKAEIPNTEGSFSIIYRANGDATISAAFPITKEDLTDKLNLFLIIEDKKIEIVLNKK